MRDTDTHLTHAAKRNHCHGSFRMVSSNRLVSSFEARLVRGQGGGSPWKQKMALEKKEKKKKHVKAQLPRDSNGSNCWAATEQPKRACPFTKSPLFVSPPTITINLSRLSSPPTFNLLRTLDILSPSVAAVLSICRNHGGPAGSAPCQHPAV